MLTVGNEEFYPSIEKSQSREIVFACVWWCFFCDKCFEAFWRFVLLDINIHTMQKTIWETFQMLRKSSVEYQCRYIKINSKVWNHSEGNADITYQSQRANQRPIGCWNREMTHVTHFIWITVTQIFSWERKGVTAVQVHHSVLISCLFVERWLLEKTNTTLITTGLARCVNNTWNLSLHNQHSLKYQFIEL